MNERLLQEWIRCIITESGAAGFAYEHTLMSALNLCDGNITTSAAAGNLSSVSDLGFTVCGMAVAAEVKLNSSDLLGSFKKKAYSSLVWDGTTFDGVVDPSHPLADIAQLILDALKNSTHAKNVMAKLNPITPYKRLPWNLTGKGATFGSAPPKADKDVFPNNQTPTDDKYIVYSLLRKAEERWPVPAVDSRGNPVSSDRIPGKQITSGCEIILSPAEISRLISAKPGPNGAPTSYIIVGNGDEAAVSGQIFSLGSDPLQIGAPPFNGSASVQMRFRGSGGKGSTRALNFDIGTKGCPGKLPSGGLQFNDAQELCSILLNSPVCQKKGDTDLDRNPQMHRGKGLDKFAEARKKNSTKLTESTLRRIIRDTLLSEELTKSDKDEIKRIAKKQAKKYVDAELDKALGASFFGKKGKVNKFVDDEINKRFKDGDKDKDFSDSVEKVSKRVLQALYSMHFKRNNLIKTMPVPKS
jgi:hypothetical protein